MLTPRLLWGSLVVVAMVTSVVHGESRTAFPKVHPRVFDMVAGWFSDSEEPVVTEINLDAVEANGNQFDFTSVRKEGLWTMCPNDDNRGFLRFKELFTDAGRFAVEFQSNGGGTLTTSRRIEFVVDQRKIHKDGKPVTMRVLRVTAISMK